MGCCFIALCRNPSRSYPRSAGCHRQCGGRLDIDRGVDVAVQNPPARPAPPDADAQGLEAVLDAARRAHLTGRLEPADAYEGTPMRDRLVLQHADKLRPPGVMDGLGHACAGQPLDHQAFDGNRLVFADQLRRELVVELAPRISDLRMLPGHLQAGLGPVAEPLRLAQQLLLRHAELRLRPPPEPRTVGLRAIGDNGEVPQPEIDTCRAAGAGQCGRLNVDNERNDKPARRIPSYRRGRGHRRKRPGPAHPYITDPGQAQALTPQAEPVPGEPHRLTVVTLRLEQGRRHARALALARHRGEKTRRKPRRGPGPRTAKRPPTPRPATLARPSASPSDDPAGQLTVGIRERPVPMRSSTAPTHR